MTTEGPDRNLRQSGRLHLPFLPFNALRLGVTAVEYKTTLLMTSASLSAVQKPPSDRGVSKEFQLLTGSFLDFSHSA